MPAVEKDIKPALDGPHPPAEEESSLTSLTQRDDSPLDEPSILRRVLRDIVLLGAGNVGVMIAQLCFRGILIAVLLPSDYGRLSLILSVYSTVWTIGASGLPSSVARYIALIAPAEDAPIIRSALWAGVGPTVIAAAVVATVAGILLASPLAFLCGAIGLSSLVYTLLTLGILRGRGKIGQAAAIFPLAGVCEVLLLLTIWRSGLGVTPLSAFGVFCTGNVIGLIIGVYWVIRTAPSRTSGADPTPEIAPDSIPSTRQLLGFSTWLTAATLAVTMLPFVLRLAAAFDSYTVVAIIDVALLLFIIPQRMGSTIVAAVVPHATRSLDKNGSSLTISNREHCIVIIPFVLLAAVVAFTPLVGWLFDAVGRPEYTESAGYFALALLAGPARVLYGIVEGVLVAHADGRFLATNAVAIAAAASAIIIAAAALGSTMVAFGVFVVAWWAIYVCGLRRIRRLGSMANST